MTDEQEIVDDIIRIVRGRLPLPVMRRRIREKLEVHRNMIFREVYGIPPSQDCTERIGRCEMAPVESAKEQE